MMPFAQCDLFSFGQEPGEFVDGNGLRHIILRDQRTRQVSAADAFSVRAARATADYDVVHFLTANKIAVAGAGLARMRGAQTFLTPLGGGGRAGIGRGQMYRLFDGFPIISNFTATECPWVLQRPHRVIYGGGDASGFPVGTDIQRPRLARIVCIGRLSAHKGVDVLIRALPSGAELVVCGQVLDEGYAGYLHMLANGKNVEFIRSASDAVVSELYASATVAVLPSVHEDFRGARHRFPELLGLVLLEAMWHGTSVVASRLGGVDEIVQEDGNGLMVSPGNEKALHDALLSLLEDSSRSARLGAAGRNLVERRFTWHRVAEETLRFYEERLPATRANGRKDQGTPA